MNFYDVFMKPLEKAVLTNIRSCIIPFAYGNVLEIGYGTGVNFKYYTTSKINKLSALDTHSAPTARGSIPVDFYEGRAESLPFADNSFDTVVETLVFCSVENLSASISEVKRVLKPGGAFIFIDHVLPHQEGLASIFKAANTIWPKIAGGCNLTREQHKSIEAAGFIIEQSGSSGNDIFRWGIAKKAI